MNLAIVTKWIIKILQNNDGLWARILKAKCFPNNSFFACNIKGSQFWNGIQKCKEVLYLGAKFSVGNGRDTKFWPSKWISDKLLYASFPYLFVIVTDPHALVCEVFTSGSANVGFLRSLTPAKMNSWESLCDVLHMVAINSILDSISRDLEASGSFSLTPTCAKLVQGPKVHFAEALWATGVPLKVCIFIWEASLDRLPSVLSLQKGHERAMGDAHFAEIQRMPITSISNVPLPTFMELCSRVFWSILESSNYG